MVPEYNALSWLSASLWVLINRLINSCARDQGDGKTVYSNKEGNRQKIRSSSKGNANKKIKN